ncbi:hypothetical protein [Hungatella hathewayi]|uniref:hypothetical protein n=1 Tax=Hungatella hathewayi TaxID=154046 RepID=UPI003568E784
MKNMRYMVAGTIVTILLCLMISDCGKRQECKLDEQPHLYWKEIEVEVISIDKKHWFASTHWYQVDLDVYSSEYELRKTFEIQGSGAFGCPKEFNYEIGDIIKAELYSWKMDSTGEIIEREIHNLQ